MVVIINGGKATITTIKDDPSDRRRVVGTDFDMIFPKAEDIAVMQSNKGCEIVFGYDTANRRLTSLNEYRASKIASTRKGVRL